jgi:hypothetical protein
VRGFGLILVLVFLTPSSALAFNSSAWTKQKGELWSLLSFGSQQASEQINVNGNRIPFIDGLEGNTFRDESFYTQFEFGMTDYLTAHFEVPYKRVFVDQELFFTNTQTVGNLYLGLRLNLLKVMGIRSSLTWSVELGGFLPTGYVRNRAPSVGPGQIDFDVKTAVGYGFTIADVLPSYAQVGVGIRARSTVFALSQAVDCPTGAVDCVDDVKPNFSDELLFLAEYGITPFKGAILAFGKVMGQVSLLEPDFGFTAANPIPTRQRIYKVGGGSFVYPLRFFSVPYGENVAIAVQYYSTVAGRNIPVTDDLFVGLEYTHYF